MSDPIGVDVRPVIYATPENVRSFEDALAELRKNKTKSQKRNARRRRKHKLLMQARVLVEEFPKTAPTFQRWADEWKAKASEDQLAALAEIVANFPQKAEEWKRSGGVAPF